MASGMRNPARTAVVIVCSLAVAVAFGLVVRQSLAATDADTQVVVAERSGVKFLHSATTLIGSLVEAQSAAVRGQAVDVPKMNNAFDKVKAQTDAVGDELGIGQRIEDLSRKISNAQTGAGSGRAAYQTYVDVMTLAMDMIVRVGDNSNLVHDPELDSYYLMDAALVQLPWAMIYAGRAVDLAYLSGGGQLRGVDAVWAAVARHGVASAADRVSAGLNKSVDNTARTTLGGNIAEQLDRFRSAADKFAPSAILNDFAREVSASELTSAAHQVFSYALQLAHLLLTELNAVLGDRQTALAGERGRTEWATYGAIALVLILIVTLILTRPRRQPPVSLAEAGVGTNGAIPNDVAVGSFTDIRRFLDDDELGVGSQKRRGTRPRAGGRVR